MVFGFRKVLLPALFNFTSLDPLEFYFIHQGIKYHRYNAIWFVHIFFIPLIPIWYDEALWKAEGIYYKREIHWRGKLLNYVVCFIGLGFVFMIVVGIAGNFS